jgi:serine/threonine protein kinase
MANQIMKLTVGGPVQAKFGTYLPRPADDQLFHACQAGTFAYVLACRQIGKSSLMFATSEKLAHAEVRTALIDLNSIGQSVDADSWYFSFIDELARRLELEVDVEIWWERRPRLSTLTQRFLQFLREVVLEEIPKSIVIFVDEIDMTLGLGFTDDFFAAIRSIYNDRAQYPAYRRLTFVLLGVATPDELIKDQTRTPFNIGQAITLRDFTKKECEPFRLELESNYPNQGLHYFDRIYEWTAGHPYLTQKLCDAVLKQGVSTLEDAAALVDMVVRKLFLAPEARGEDNIQFVQTRVANDPYVQEMLRIYKRILGGEKPVYDDEQSAAINRLKLYGLVVAQSEKLRIRNKIYAHAFDLSWATEMLRLSSTSVKLGLPDHYKVLQEIGQGGFATVYLAQLRDSDKTQSVALKVLKADISDDSNRVKRFKQEALAISKLEHPNIIRILETGGEETLYIAMEYIPGGTLCDRLKTGPLPRDEAVHILRHIGEALTLAHEQGIIHRDIKPGNILLDMNQKPVRPVLTDFGLVKVLAGDSFTRIQSTAIMGTLDYMAPEQWRQEPPTPATDVYALAITFFEMLAGQCPFHSKSGYYELMNKHLEEPLPLLSSVAPEVGSFFDDVLIRATAKEPSARFESVTQFIQAIEVANEQAEEVERIAQQDQAAKTVEVARSYTQRGRYDPEKALSMVEIALEMCPGYLDALRLRAAIQFKQEQFEAALDDYKQAYEQVGVPASEVGIEYLVALSQVAETYWQGQMYPEAIKYYEMIRQILGEDNHESASIQEIWEKTRTRLVEYHHYEGDRAYAGGNPENIDDATNLLGEKIQVLAALKADSESEDLWDKLRLLQVKKYENIVNLAQATIDEIAARDSQVRFGNEDIFQHYLTIDEAYQSLIELEPENKQWQEDRRKKLKEWAEGRYMFAIWALEKPEPDYEAGLRHYKALLDIEQAKYPGVAQELNLNLDERIVELQAKVDYDGKYNEILRLIDSQDYLRALEHLDREFIQAGNYEHRDVARWLWGLVYAKRHEGNFPPEWESLSGFDALSKRLVRVERAWIQQLKDRLEPWSQSGILETIGNEARVLGDFEEQVTGIESVLNEAVARGVAEIPEIDVSRDELTGVRAQIQKQRSAFFDIDVKETAQKVDAWLQKIEEIEALLQTGNPVKDIPEFLNRSDEEKQAIEKDPMFETLQVLESTSAEIEQTIGQIELQIRGRLCTALIDDVGQKDEELVRLRTELATLQEELAKAQEGAAISQADLAQLREEIAVLQQRESLLEQQLEKPNREHEINRYVIPISLALAVIAGGIVAPQIRALPGLSTVKWIALALLIAYFAYYVWVYYISRPRSE